MITFAWCGDNLKAILATYKEQTPRLLHAHTLSSRMMMSDEGIIKRYNITPVTLSDIFHALQTHTAVLRNEHANIFYIINSRGLLMCLHAYLTTAGWYCDVNSIQRNFRWRDGRKVFTL